MSEVTFAKSFLATLDKRPIKLPADHVSDPHKFPHQSPVRTTAARVHPGAYPNRLQYILPKQTHPFPRKTGPTSTQKSHDKTITATLKPMRAGETVTLPDTTLDTTIHDLKAQYAQKTGVPQDKIKLLLSKKPAADLKTLKDLGVDRDMELSVMILGATGTTPRAQSPAVEKSEPKMPAPPPAADKMDIDEAAPAPESERATAEANQSSEGSTAAEMLKTKEFWSDLQGFLSQRLRDEKEGENLAGLFKEAWSKR